MKAITEFFDFLQKIKTPGPWVFAIFFIAYLDWYALEHIGLSFSELLWQPALIQKWADQQWVFQLTLCIAQFSFVWFVGLSLIIMPLLNWMIIECQCRLPEFFVGSHRYRSKENHVHLPTAKRYAIVKQNKLLFEYCETKL